MILELFLLLGVGYDVMPDSLRDSRESAGYAAIGDVIEFGIGKGYTMEGCLGSSRVSSYTGVDITLEHLNVEVGWRDKSRVKLLEADALYMLSVIGDDAYDTVIWDIHPMIVDGKTVDGWLDTNPKIFEELKRVAKQRVIWFGWVGDGSKSLNPTYQVSKDGVLLNVLEVNR